MKQQLAAYSSLALVSTMAGLTSPSLAQNKAQQNRQIVSAAANASETPIEKRIREIAENFINDDPMNPKYKLIVNTLPDTRNAIHVYLAGGNKETIPQAEITEVVARLQLISKLEVLVISHLKPTPTPPAPKPPPPAEIITRIQPLRFLRNALPRENVTDTAGVDAAATDLAKYLGALYPNNEVAVTASENRLVMTGRYDRVQKLQQMLALYLDVPSPLVRAEVLTIQINSSPGRKNQAAADTMNEVKAGVQIVRDLMQGAQLAMAKYLAKEHSVSIANNMKARVRLDNGTRTTYKALFKRVGFDINPARPLSTSELLIFMTFCDRGQLKRDLGANGELTNLLKNSLLQIKTHLGTGNNNKSLSYSAPDRKSLISLVDRMIADIEVTQSQAGQRHLLDRIAKSYGPESAAAEQKAIAEFLDAWYLCSEDFSKEVKLPEATPVDRDALSGRLANRSAATDLLLKQAMDALTADLQDVFLHPLHDWVRTKTRKGSRKAVGVDVVGTTTLLVRDRTLAETKGDAESFSQFTPIKKLPAGLLTDTTLLSDGTTDSPEETLARDKDGIVKDKDDKPFLLPSDKALVVDDDGKVIRGKDNQPLTRTKPKSKIPATILDTLNPTQGFLLKALFASDSDPVYRKIAPGTSLFIRPFVLADGGSARVQLRLINTLSSTPAQANDQVQQGRPVDQITNHSTLTEASISAFDLVEISSFGAQTTSPGEYKWNIPVLSGLPVLGQMFHGPQGFETHRQDSIAILNLTILPRSLDLVPFLHKAVPPKPAK